ncbi:MAG: ATP-dependent Clp protease ATP-binding subunit [Paraprevotella sp.]|nr:ATP-dependent Clp protease ATP-binding subunit [Paraprevotella sp.]
MAYKYYDNDTTDIRQQNKLLKSEESPFIAGFEFADEEDENDLNDFSTSANRNGESSTTKTINHQKKSANNTPFLDKFGTDLTRAAKDGILDPIVGREKEIERVSQILSRRKKNNPILIGEPGVGKSAIVEGLALRITQKKVSRTLFNKRIIALDMAAVVAGTKFRGQFEERIQNILTELKKNPDVILFIDEIHTIIGAGSTPGSMDAANMLKPALARGEMQCIGATTTDEFRKTIEKDGALDRRFQKVMIVPTTFDETIKILENIKDRYEEHHNVTYSDEAIRACVRLAERYLCDRTFPDKAIDVMDEAGSRIHINHLPISKEMEEQEQKIETATTLKNEAVKNGDYLLAADYRDQEANLQEEYNQMKEAWEKEVSQIRSKVDEEQIAEVVSLMTGIPVQRMSESEGERLRSMSPKLKNEIIGQDEAIEKLVRSIQRGRMGLKDPNKPIGTFLFVGPTGVGKTYLAKKLAEYLFGSKDALIRIDMSEYMEKHTVSRMVGAPPGYIGHDEGGQLTEKVRRKPYSIILLDELEKAHADVFNILLQVMDEGRLTDSNGVTVNFNNTVIIMTSNCGTKQLKEFGNGIGFNSVHNAQADKKHSRSLIEKSLHKQFAPEFINRLDDIIHFDQLKEDDIKRIVDIELQPVIKRVNELGYDLTIDDSAKVLLSQKGYDIQYGARPLKRAIQSYLEDTICDLMVNNEISTHDRLIAKAEENERIIIEKKQ